MPAPDPAPVVLVVDDEPGLREVLQIALTRQGYRVVCKPGCKSAIALIEERPLPFSLVITDLVMPDGSGMDVLEAARDRSDQTQVIVVTAYSTVEKAIDAMRQGAYDFVTKPFSPMEIAALASKALEKSSIVAENRHLRARLKSILPEQEPTDLFGSEPEMRRLATLVRKAASTRTTVLITGESGTGKERTARMLHELSERAEGPFCVINCGALPEALMESELFGHEQGAFTGAISASGGLFRQAEGGSLFLDEIGELPTSLQVKLLRALQERKVRPVGATVEVPIDVRVIAATNRNVEQEVEQGRFRKDLYYRLNVIRIELPPLRERRSDIPGLAKQMVARFADEFEKDDLTITPQALRTLEGHDFPGNIRELENAIERAAALCADQQIDVDDLPESVIGKRGSHRRIITDLPEDGCELDEVLAHAERRMLMQALERTGGVRKSAAELLGISFRSIRYRLQKLGMETDKNEAESEPSPDLNNAERTKSEK